MKKTIRPDFLDSIDWKLLDLMQRDSSRSNQLLAELLSISPATCLRRMRKLRDLGLIEREIAVIAPDRLAQFTGHGLHCLVEVTLDRQDSESLDVFEESVVTDECVQQCWRVSPGPDFILVIYATDMPQYLEASQRLFTQHSNVRNVKAFFSTKRAKFSTYVPVPNQAQT